MGLSRSRRAWRKKALAASALPVALLPGAAPDAHAYSWSRPNNNQPYQGSGTSGCPNPWITGNFGGDPSPEFGVIQYELQDGVPNEPWNETEALLVRQALDRVAHMATAAGTTFQGRPFLKFVRVPDPNVAMQLNNRIVFDKAPSPGGFGGADGANICGGNGSPGLAWITIKTEVIDRPASSQTPPPPPSPYSAGGVDTEMVLVHEVLHALGLGHTGATHAQLPGFAGSPIPIMSTCAPNLATYNAKFITSDDLAAFNQRWYQEVAYGTDPGRWVPAERWVTPNPGFEPPYTSTGWKTVYPGTMSFLGPTSVVQGSMQAEVSPVNPSDGFVVQSHAIISGEAPPPQSPGKDRRLYTQAAVQLVPGGRQITDAGMPQIRGFTRRVVFQPSPNPEVANCDSINLNANQYPVPRPHGGPWAFDQGTVFVGVPNNAGNPVVFVDGEFQHQRLPVAWQVGSVTGNEEPVTTLDMPPADGYYTIFQLEPRTDVYLDNAGLLRGDTP